MHFSFKRITVLFLTALMLFLITGCKDKPKTESSIVSKTEIKTESETEHSTTADINIADVDDTKDPENTESTQNVDGEKVNFAEVESKKGMQNGIDVSKWQGKIDWQKVKNAGIDFAIIRIGTALQTVRSTVTVMPTIISNKHKRLAFL